jgi:hypothetical protein
MILFAQIQEDYAGWYIGLGVGFTVVVVVVILVAMILMQASRIGHQALDGIELMDEARESSLSVWDLQTMNVNVSSIWKSAEAARHALSGTPR